MISLQQLSYQVGHKHLLQPISVQFESGQIHALMGANGAGKTTLLKCLAQDHPIAPGLVVWQGQDLTAWSAEKMAQTRAVLSQNQSLNFSFSVGQIVMMGLSQNATLLPNQYATAFDALMAVFDLSALQARDYLTLSGGEQQRCQFARVLAQIYRLDGQYAGYWLLLDEWTNGLDLHHQQKLAGHLRQWRQQGMGIIMVAHDLNLVLQLADYGYLLKQGELVDFAPPNELLTPEKLLPVFDVEVLRLSQNNHQWLQVFSQ